MRVDINEVPNACNYCRKIMNQPDYPKTLELYRGEMLCLTVDVERASKLKLVEKDKRGLIYVKYTEDFFRKASRSAPRTTVQAFS